MGQSSDFPIQLSPGQELSQSEAGPSQLQAGWGTVPVREAPNPISAIAIMEQEQDQGAISQSLFNLSASAL